MRTRAQYMLEYMSAHQLPLNQAIHLICVPLIFVSSTALLWSVSLAWMLPTAPPGLVPWLNLAVLVALPILGFYVRLGTPSFVSGLVWMLISAAICLGMQSAGLPLPWIAGSVWLAAWAVQLYGHHAEGAKPSFFKDLVFLLIGPLFVQDKLFGALRPKTVRV